MTVVAQVGGGDAVALAVVLAIVYLVIVRFLDLNEKEPLWAMAMVFGIGVVAALLAYLVVGSPTLELRLVLGAVIREVFKIVAVGLAVWILAAIGRSRGWSEVDGALDGVVYGMAVGLGFATGAVFARELFVAADPSLDLMPTAGGFAQLWPVALRGLSEGLFGGVIGAGFGLAARATDAGKRTSAIAGGALAAVVLHVLYNLLARGQAATSAGRALALLGLFLPLVVVAGLVVWSLRQERRIIAEQLPGEGASGLVTAEDMRLLSSFGARRGAYARRVLSGDFDGWTDLKALHNRQVQLAFAKDRAGRDPSAQSQVDRLRDSIQALKAPVSTGEGRSD